MSENRPNFFRLLGINPDDPWSDARFRQILQERKETWKRRESSVGPPAQEAKRNLALLDEIEAVMLSPARRTQEARAAEARTADPAPAEALSSQVDAALLASVKRLLGEANHISIYEIFHLPPAGPLDVLQRSMERFHSELASSPSTERHIQMLRELVAYGRIIFRTASNKQRYDESLSASVGTDSGSEETSGTADAGPGRGQSEQMIGDNSQSREAGPTTSFAYLDQEAASPVPHGSVEEEPPVFAQKPPATPVAEEAVAATAWSRAGAARPAPDDISGLTLKNLDGALNLKWTWPANCTEALLTYDHFNWPQPGQPDVIQIRITRSEYEIRGHYELRGPLDRPYFIVVAAVLRRSGVLVVTPGEQVQGYMARKLLVDYEIKNARFGARQRTLHLYTSVPGRIPTLLLRSCVGHPPLTRDEGMLFQRIVGPLNVHGELVVPLLNEGRPNTFGRLFLEDESLYTVITLCRPPERKLSFGR